MTHFTDDRAQGLTTETVDPLRYGGKDQEAVQHPDPDEAIGILIAMVPSGSRLLDVGCGAGVITRLFRDLKQCDVVGIEPHPLRASVSQKLGLEVLVGEFSEETAAQLGMFDTIVFADVLEHLVDPASAVRLAHTHLHPKGSILISVPNVAHWTVRWNLLWGRFDYKQWGIMDATHLRWFTCATLTNMLQDAGFEVSSIKASAGVWLPEYAANLPWKWLPARVRVGLIRGLTKRLPALFGAQWVFMATPK